MIELTYLEFSVYTYLVGVFVGAMFMFVSDWDWRDIIGTTILWPILILFTIGGCVWEVIINSYYYFRYGESKDSFNEREDMLYDKLKYYGDDD